MGESCKIHAVYCVLALHFKKSDISYVYQVDKSSINRWIKNFKETGSPSRKQHKAVSSRFKEYHKASVVRFINSNPLLTLYELKLRVEEEYKSEKLFLSPSSVWRILVEKGYSYVVMERRALQSKRSMILAYTLEINSLTPLVEQLLFLDEMSIDSRAMLKKRGFFIRGTCPVYHGNFARSERISILGFCNHEGFLEVYKSKGTFTRSVFFEKIRSLVNSGKVQAYPGRNSVWVMDGAAIHVDANIIYYLRSVGVRILFLPAFCPFFNPIEYLFGYLKDYCQKNYREKGMEEFTLAAGIKYYERFDMGPTFAKCGYSQGLFDPAINWKNKYAI